MLWVQSPTGMPATHGSCIGSGGRDRTCVGCVQSAAGIPDNPHLNDLAGRLGIEPSKAGFGDRPPPRGQPEIDGRQCARCIHPYGCDSLSGRS